MYINQIEMYKGMKNKELNQRKLSKMTGISTATINGVYNGRKTRKETAEKIAAALGVSVSVLASDRKY